MRMTDQAGKNLQQLLAELRKVISIQQINSPKNMIVLSGDPTALTAFQKFLKMTCAQSKFTFTEESDLQINAGESDDLAKLLNTPLCRTDFEDHEKILTQLYANELYAAVCKKYKSNNPELGLYFRAINLEQLLICSKLLDNFGNQVDLSQLEEKFNKHFKYTSIAKKVNENCQLYFKELIDANLLQIELETDFALFFHTGHPLIQQVLPMLFRKERIAHTSKSCWLLSVSALNLKLYKFLEDENNPLGPAQTHCRFMEQLIAVLKTIITEDIIEDKDECARKAEALEGLLFELASRKPAEGEATPDRPRKLQATNITLPHCLKVYADLGVVRATELESRRKRDLLMTERDKLMTERDKLMTKRDEFMKALPTDIRQSQLFKSINKGCNDTLEPNFASSPTVVN